MTLLLHETQGTLKSQLMSEGIKNHGYSRPYTVTVNEVLNKHRPSQFEFDRSEAVYFSCERDYLKFKKNNSEQIVVVDSNKLDPYKLFVFPNSIAEVILNRIEHYGHTNLKTEAENYWNTGFPFHYYDKNHVNIEEQFTSYFKQSGFGDFEYCPEVLYFDEVPAQLLSSYKKSPARK